MKVLPEIKTLEQGGVIWETEFPLFRIKVYVPEHAHITEIVNFGFMAPYLLIFEENENSVEEAVDFAEKSGLAEIAAGYGSSVVFVYPATEGGWESADEELFISLIAETRISQYYKNGMATMRNRFTKQWEDTYIRGALHRSFLYGKGASADYIVRNLLKTIVGNGLYGEGDITPAGCILEKLSVKPAPKRRDIPVISIGNSNEINEAFSSSLDYVYIKDRAEYKEDFHNFLKKFRRMVGGLNIEEDFIQLGMAVRPGYTEVAVSPDNRGDARGTSRRIMGYVAYCAEEVLAKKEPLPLVLCFHGGGDSAMCMAALTNWPLVALKYGFLLVCVENHMDGTATEAMELLEHLKTEYSIDEERIYSTGFSMGGCKTWDLFQEYPETFAAVAPMDATFEVGQNVFADWVEEYNEDVVVPVFYVGGELSPLPELPFQEERCRNRMSYVLKVNQAKNPYDVDFAHQESWENPLWGVNGDAIYQKKDPERDSILTMHLFESTNGCCYSIFGGGSGQYHEMRYINCENAWIFMSHFRRLEDHTIAGGKMEEIKKAYGE